MKILILSLATLLSVAHCHSESETITATLSIGTTQQLGKDVSCKVTITNNYQDQDVHLLKRSTPLDSLSAPIFAVTHEGKPLTYEGLLYKRVSPSDEDYVTIPARASISSTIDLSKIYKFKFTGKYSIKMETVLRYFIGSAVNSTLLRISSNVATLFLEGSSFQPRETLVENLNRNTNLTQNLRVAVGAAKKLYFAGKTVSSRVESDSTTAYSKAYSLLSKCYSSVDGNPSLYSKWFGTRYIGYTDTVKGVYLNIKSSMESLYYTMYFLPDDCERGVVAYTYFGSTTVYVCDGYVNAQVTGFDSKMGTIVHEWSHAVARTEDHMYGQSDCQYLAKNNPRQAINNADNYEYFAESLY